MQTFSDSLPLAKEEMLNQTVQTTGLSYNTDSFLRSEKKLPAQSNDTENRVTVLSLYIDIFGQNRSRKEPCQAQKMRFFLFIGLEKALLVRLAPLTACHQSGLLGEMEDLLRSLCITSGTGIVGHKVDQSLCDGSLLTTCLSPAIHL